MESEQRHHEFISKANLVALGILVIASFGAFSKKSKDEIYKRDKGKSVISGKGKPLHVAHINHDKNSPDYNKPHNGRLLTPKEHLEIDHINRAGRNGLPEHQNNWAIMMLRKLIGDDD